MSVATLPFPPQSTTRRPFRLSLVLAARATFQICNVGLICRGELGICFMGCRHDYNL